MLSTILATLLAVALSFPPLPKDAVALGTEPQSCGTFIIWVTYYDHDGDSKMDRSVYSTQNDVPFAVILWDSKTEKPISYHILIAGKVQTFKQSADIPISPCETAERLQDADKGKI